MRAMVIREFGGPSVFSLEHVAMAGMPQLKCGHVLVRVAGSSVNPIDLKMRSGAVPAVTPPLPAVLHGDVSGTIEGVGEGVTRFKIGDEVFGFAGGFKGLPGALAEHLEADAALLARKPAKVNLLDAAALPVVGITAWEALVERAQVRPGQRVLVHAGCGGVGHMGVQLARAAGAIVYTTVSGEDKCRAARKLGADVAINYNRQSVAEYVADHTDGQGFDVVFDTVGGPNLAGSFLAARPGGTVVTVAARSTQDLSPVHARGLSLHAVFIGLPLLTGQGRQRHGQILEQLSRLIDSDRLKRLADPEVFDFRDVSAAHRKLESGKAMGKIRLQAAF